MKYCPYCGNALDDDMLFCNKCGKAYKGHTDTPATNQANQQPVAAAPVSRTTVVQHICSDSYPPKDERTRKKEKVKKTIGLVVLIAIIAVILISCIASKQQEKENSLSRNMATETMNTYYTNVYANVTHLEPYYAIYETTSHVAEKDLPKYGTLVGIVCKCKTVEGRNIWAYLLCEDYPAAQNSKNEEDYTTHNYSSNTPLRLIGKIDKPNEIESALEDEIGDVFVLSVFDTTFG